MPERYYDSRFSRRSGGIGRRARFRVIYEPRRLATPASNLSKCSTNAASSYVLLHTLHTWMDSWAGIGHVAVGMYRQGYDLQMTRYDERGSRATFYTTGMEHLPTSATGTGWQRTPWHVTQRAAWGVVRQDASRGAA